MNHWANLSYLPTVSAHPSSLLHQTVGIPCIPLGSTKAWAVWLLLELFQKLFEQVGIFLLLWMEVSHFHCHELGGLWRNCPESVCKEDGWTDGWIAGCRGQCLQPFLMQQTVRILQSTLSWRRTEEAGWGNLELSPFFILQGLEQRLRAAGWLECEAQKSACTSVPVLSLCVTSLVINLVW